MIISPDDPSDAVCNLLTKRGGVIARHLFEVNILYEYFLNVLINQQLPVT